MEHQGKQTCLQWMFEKYGMRAGFKNGLSRMTPENANEIRKGTDFPDGGSKYHALSDMEKIEIKREDGTSIKVTVIQSKTNKANTNKLAVLHAHGGGAVAGTAEYDNGLMARVA